jgi:hypothetical protein
MGMGIYYILACRKAEQQHPGINNMVYVLFQVSIALTAAAKISFFSYQRQVVAT